MNSVEYFQERLRNFNKIVSNDQLFRCCLRRFIINLRLFADNPEERYRVVLVALENVLKLFEENNI